jgi:hypothetical protein
MIRSKPIACALLLSVWCIAANAKAAGIAGQYTGRYQCQQWRPLELQISEHGGGRITGVFTFQGQGGSGSYSMVGTYDAASGRIQLAPERWMGRHPTGVTMVGLDGRFDPTTRRLSGRVTDFNCMAFEVVPPGTALTALPGPPAPPPPPELRPTPTNVTGLNASFEYRDSAMSDAPGTVRESEPIDDVIDWMRKEGFSCMDTAHVSWDASGTRGTAGDLVRTRERYVIECDGNCRGVHYVPYANAQITHFGTSMPVPVIELKNVWLGELQFRWNITRDTASQPPPDIYIHRWTASGFNARGACKAPKSDNKSGVRR